MMFSLLVMFTSFYFVFSILDKKILILLSLEIFFLSMIMTYISLGFSPNKCSFFMFLLALMMVVDSVFALSVLISCGRSSGEVVLKSSVF